MPSELIQDAAWPGVRAIASLIGSIGHGITPSRFILTTIPQDDAPAEFGDLVITDGQRAVTLRGCKADRLTPRVDSDGTTWVLEILDRRWKWRGPNGGLGAVSGSYNAMHARLARLIPWTIRSPEELARLCLDAMGETGYEINLPKGLPKATGANLNRYLQLGENFPQSLANPPVIWDHTPPAEALARFCDDYGCRVIYQPVADRVLITPLGEGDDLPNGPCEAITDTIDAPETPEAVGVAGAPIRYQMRLALEAVGIDWHGFPCPIEELSYAPQSKPKVQIDEVTYLGSNPNASVEVDITAPNGKLFQFASVDPALTVVAKWALIAGWINAGAAAAFCTAAATDLLTLTGVQAGVPFGVAALNPSVPTDPPTVTLIQGAEAARGTWAHSGPPLFENVNATDRLSFDQAQQLARRSVFRCYRVKFVDVATGKAPIVVPRYGPLVRRQQLILQPAKVVTLFPRPRDPNGSDKNNTVGTPGSAGILPEQVYTGVEVDQRATVHGSIAWTIGAVIWNPNSDRVPNSKHSDRIYVDFDIDPVEQVVTFAEPIYRFTPGSPGRPDNLGQTFAPAELVLETAVLVQDADTSALKRFEKLLPLGGIAPPQWSVREDVQIGVVGTYDDDDKLTSTTTFYADDANPRADFYLAGMARQYQLTAGETRQYIGIYPIDPDGLVQQVTWSIGAGGATTVASTNTEHTATIRSYPERRRAENLPPNAAAAAANLLEAARLKAAVASAATTPLGLGAAVGGVAFR